MRHQGVHRPLGRGAHDGGGERLVCIHLAGRRRRRPGFQRRHRPPDRQPAPGAGRLVLHRQHLVRRKPGAAPDPGSAGNPPRRTLQPGPTQVILEGSNDDDSFFYTLNGTEPTTASPRYAGPIAVERTATLSVVGVNSAGEQGQIRTFTYTIDPNADLERPVITLVTTVGPMRTPSTRCLPCATTDPRPLPPTSLLTAANPAYPHPSMWKETRTDWRARRYPSPLPPACGSWWWTVPATPDPAQLLLQHRSQGGPRQFPRGDHLLPPHHPLLRRRPEQQLLLP